MTGRWNPGTFLTGLCLLLLPGSALSPQVSAGPSTVTVVGRVADRVTGQLLENALIRIPELGIHLLSDSAGQFRLAGIRAREG